MCIGALSWLIPERCCAVAGRSGVQRKPADKLSCYKATELVIRRLAGVAVNETNFTVGHRSCWIPWLKHKQDLVSTCTISLLRKSIEQEKESRTSKSHSVQVCYQTRLEHRHQGREIGQDNSDTFPGGKVQQNRHQNKWKMYGGTSVPEKGEEVKPMQGDGGPTAVKGSVT